MRALGVVRRSEGGRMKAFLLAAGVGSRLRPITDTIPKCMVTIGGQPMLDIWLDALRPGRRGRGAGQPAPSARGGQRLSGRTDRAACRPDRRSSRTCWAARARCAPTGTGWPGRICSWPATPTTSPISTCATLVDAHRSHDVIATLAAFHSAEPVGRRGAGDWTPTVLVTAFTEKPAAPVSDLVNAGMYAFSPKRARRDRRRIRPATSATTCCRGWSAGPGPCRSRGIFRDIGTIDAYRQAREEWPERALR